MSRHLAQAIVDLVFRTLDESACELIWLDNEDETREALLAGIDKLIDRDHQGR